MKKVNSCKPTGGIQLVVGPSVWMGMEMEADESLLHILTIEQLEEIDLMLRKVEQEAAPLYEINRLDYPLTTLQSTFDSIEADLERGRGFALAIRLSPPFFAFRKHIRPTISQVSV